MNPLDLRVRGVSAGYGGVTVLHDVDLDVAGGTCHTIVGLNGAGKTTLLHVLAGLVRAAGTGSVRLGGTELCGLAAYRVARAGVRLVPQGRRVFPTLTVTEHLALSYHDTRPGPWRPAVILERLPALAQRRGYRAGTLSGGEQQMLALARALLGNPGLLLADEPTEGLAPELATGIRELLAEAAGHGTTLVVTESRAGEPAAHRPPVSELRQGRLRTVPAEPHEPPEAPRRDPRRTG